MMFCNDICVLHRIITQDEYTLKLSMTKEGDEDAKMTIEEINALFNDEKTEPEDRKPSKIKLHYWHIGVYKEKWKKYIVGHGIVTGHKYIEDSADITTSPIQQINVDEERDKLVFSTKNSVYHCPLSYCDFKEQDKYPDLIPEYTRLKEKYNNTIKYPSIDSGKILLVLADFCCYYFHSVYYVPKDSKNNNPLKFRGFPHLGTYQDSYLIRVEGTKIDLRYFPHYRNIEFYEESTDGMPLYIENLGDATIYARTSCGIIKLLSGERKEVIKENAETKEIVLPRGHLYPAFFLG